MAKKPGFIGVKSDGYHNNYYILQKKQNGFMRSADFIRSSCNLTSSFKSKRVS